MARRACHPSIGRRSPPSPGVCFRLFSQAALALDTLHKAGLAHGNLGEGSIFLTGDGIVKISGAGEPILASYNAERRNDS